MKTSTSFAKRASVWFASTAALGWTTRQLDPDERRQDVLRRMPNLA
jgi:hypothetical protein